MLLPRVNLQRKLEVFRNRSTSEEELLEQVRLVLKTRDKENLRVLESLQNGNASGSNDFIFDTLDTGRIFHISHIREIAITYRLRFLPTKYFKSPFPPETLQEIRRLEKDHGIWLQDFHILAPSKHFKLENADDPILFAPMGNDYFYLVHKWGRDLHPLRKLMMWPLKCIENLGIFVFLFSFVVALLFRELFYAGYRETYQFIMLYMFSFKSILGLIIFYGIALSKNFNNSIWKSKYYNL
mgnify:CR=1 FL=1